MRIRHWTGGRQHLRGGAHARLWPQRTELSERRDASSARENLEAFKRAFPDKDLYYADGSSFRETMGVLLGQADSKDFGQFAVLNVGRPLKDEMRRMDHWKRN